MVIEGLQYTAEHEWIKIQGNTATVGITDYAQEMLGEITYVELPPPQKELAMGAEAAVVESSKSAADIYSPAAGTVTEVNEALETTCELINQDCYEKGWLFKLEIADGKISPDLMDAKSYDEHLKEL